VAITERGNAKLDSAFDVHLEYLDKNLTARLSPSERVSLTKLLTKLNAPR
jgi:DNA-binding MarR family transcriptional regulator